MKSFVLIRNFMGGLSINCLHTGQGFLWVISVITSPLARVISLVLILKIQQISLKVLLVFVKFMLASPSLTHVKIFLHFIIIDKFAFAHSLSILL
jgi:hypothetical protein